MIPVYNSSKRIYIRLHTLRSLIFFAFIFSSCLQNQQHEITIVWDNKQAIAIAIPKNLLNATPEDSMKYLLQVRVEKNDSIAMLGEYCTQDDNIIFKPLIPLSRGLGYDIFFRDKLIGKIKVPSFSDAVAPVLVNIYPTADTLPENLLKIYLQFSKPMREGESQQHIFLLGDKSDTIPNVFLYLEPELWNQDRTVLTVWLDPGRVKRDLIPNQKLGSPLKKGNHYTIAISEKWKDAQGLQLQQSYKKQFITAARDSLSPDANKWILNVPASQTKQPLQINFGEPLDYFLLQETLQVIDVNNNVVDGNIVISNKERTIHFIPKNKWRNGVYRLQIRSMLEDLAANNLNRLFDRDMNVKKINADREMFEREFEVK